MPVNSFWSVRISGQRYHAPRCARLALLLLALALVGLNGCKSDEPMVDKDLHDYIHPAEVKEIDVSSDPVAADLNQPQPYTPPKVSLNGIGAGATEQNSMDVDGVAHGGKYYTDFCDIYWKLNWMRKELRHGSVPYNMQDEIDKMFKELKPLPKDGNYTLADEALQRMQKGLEHLACLRVIHAAQIHDQEVPWEAGLTAVQQYFDRNHIIAEAPVAPLLPAQPRNAGNDDDENGGHSHALSIVPDLTPNGVSTGQRQAINLVIDYVTRYQAGPRAMMEREWETAIRRTNKLRNNLHAENRPQNNDGDGYNVEMAVSVAAGDYGAIHVPADAGVGSIAPIEVDYPQQ